MNERVLNYGTKTDEPRRDGASAWYCCWLGLASSLQMATLLLGLSRAALQAVLLLSVATALACIALGVRCFWRRELDRAVAVFGIFLLLPALAGHLFVWALYFGYIGFPP